jgi:hypothetical protein
LLDVYHADSKDKTIVPLDTLFLMQHPNFINAAWTKSRLVNGVDKERVLFYEECRGLINFLLVHSKETPIFSAIAEGARKGETMAQWLQANGMKYGLPTQVKALDEEWRHWLDQQQ